MKLLKGSLLCGAVASSMWLLPSCTHPSTPKTIYAVIDTSTPKGRAMSKDLLHEIGKVTYPTDTVIVDELSVYQTHNLLAKSQASEGLSSLEKLMNESESFNLAMNDAGKRAVYQALHNIDTEVTDLAMLDAGRRAVFLSQRSKNFQVYFVSPGISDPEHIPTFKISVDKLAETPSVKGVSLIGLDSKSNDKITTAFSSMSDRVNFISAKDVPQTIAKTLTP